ncbi:MAG: hypothetical protein IJT27_07465 [Clostridia bacterium]|nr:hypothetical protein [Clostridia bacterium]
MRAFFARIWAWIKKVLHIKSKQDNDPGEIVDYYGCPNSNKAKKLQLSKNIYR